MKTEYGSPPLRVTVVSASGTIGGAETWLLALLDTLQQRVHLRAILFSDGPLRRELLERGVDVTVRRTGRSLRHILGAVPWMRAQMKRHNPDLTLANGVKAAAVTVPAAKLAGVRSVWVKHDHSHDSVLSGRLTRLLGRWCTRVIATGTAVGDAVQRTDTAVIEPPHPEQPLNANDARDRLQQHGMVFPEGGPDSGHLLAMVSRRVPYKGIDTAIRALAHPSAAEWHLVSIGADDSIHPGETQRLRDLAAEYGVSQRVQFLDAIPAAGTLLSAFDAAAVLTRPAGKRTPGCEGYSMLATEAMLAQLPVIATPSPSLQTRLEKLPLDADAAGIIVPPNDAEALAHALMQLSCEGIRESMGAEGRRRAERCVSVQSTAERLSRLLATTALRPGAGRKRADGPPITVLAPVLNEGLVMEKLLEIITPQLGEDDEFLLIDGGSTDGTVETINRWIQRDSRIRLIDDTGGNIAHSRNVGMSQARHVFVACTDAGCDPSDTWVETFRAAAADVRDAQIAAEQGEAPKEECFSMVLGVYHTGIRPNRPFEKAMAAISWADPVELRRPTPFRRAYSRALGRWFLSNRVEGRSVGFTRASFDDAGGFPEYLATAEDEAFGKNLIAAGHRSVQSVDATVTWHQRDGIRAAFKQFRGYGDGGGTSRSPLLVMRDVVRLVGYASVAALPILFGWTGAAVAAVGAGVYLSLPIARLVRRQHSLWLLPLLPACYLLKDTAKMLGTFTALLRRRSA